MYNFIRSYKRYLFILSDTALICISFILSILLIYNYDMQTFFSITARNSIILSISCFLVVFYIAGIYKNIWATASIQDYMKIFFNSILSFILISSLFLHLRNNLLPYKIIFLALFFSTWFIMISRTIVRMFYSLLRESNLYLKSGSNKNLLIIGAGSACRIVLNDIYNNPKLHYNIIGLVDDDKLKHNNIVSGAKILGGREDIIRICRDKMVDEILIAVPSAGENEIRKIFSICSETDCKIKTLPSIDQIINSCDNLFNKVRDIQIEDLLERQPVKLENDEISKDIENKIVMVTGAGGSIGGELCRQIANFNPRELIMLDIYENGVYDLKNELERVYPSLKITVLIASVRDENRLTYIFETYHPSMVFHAAAHKHVPLMEDSPGEAVKNNIFGTYNIARCASKNNVEKFVMISTDKAVNPTNVMGATKRVCEMIIQSMQSISNTEFVAVRFGNVLGSNGSVVPLFKKQIEEGGPVTVTDKRITRFFMTIPEAAQLVLQSSSYAKGGEIFILDMGQPVKIYDLALNLIRLSGYKPHIDIKIKFVGLRPGEKLYEELLMNEEGLQKTAHSKIFVAQPLFCDINCIIAYLSRLDAAVLSNDDNLIRSILSELVPTYTYQEEEISEKILA